MEKVKQEGALRAAEAIQANMSEDAEKAAAALEQQEREASERLAELKAAEELKNTCGVVEHGLFCGMTTAVIFAGKEGISQKNA